MGSGTNGIPGAATVVPFTNRTSAPCGPRRPAFFSWRDFKDWVVSVLGSHTVELSAKANKVDGGTVGNLVGIGADNSLVDSGLRADGLQPLLTFDATPTAGSLNPVTSGGIKQAIDAATPSDYEQVKAQVSQNTSDIDAIEGKIPSQASAQNQLADRNFVNSSIATNTATFRGTYNLVSDLGLTVAATEQLVAAAIVTKLASLVPPVTPENNDYVFVQVPKPDADSTVIDRIDRYKYTVTESGGATTRVWGYEWSLNNSSFTADQWAAINSGITSELVAKLENIEPRAQVNKVTDVTVNGTSVLDGTVAKVVVPAETRVNAYAVENPASRFPITYVDSSSVSHTIIGNAGLAFLQDTTNANKLYCTDAASGEIFCSFVLSSGVYSYSQAENDATNIVFGSITNDLSYYVKLSPTALVSVRDTVAAASASGLSMPLSMFPITYTYDNTEYSISAVTGNAGLTINFTDEPVYGLFDATTNIRLCAISREANSDGRHPFVAAATGVSDLKFAGIAPLMSFDHPYPYLVDEVAISVLDTEVAKRSDVATMYDLVTSRTHIEVRDNVPYLIVP